MDMFWNKRLSILKFPIIFVAMLQKFLYSHTFNNQVLQPFLDFIIHKTIIIFLNYSLRIFAGFIHNGILLLRSIWWILKRRGSVRRRLWRMNIWRRTILKSLFSWWILKRTGSVRRKLWRMNTWRRTMLKSLFSWCILKMRGNVRRLQRMNMWRRIMLKSLFSWWILRRGSVRRRPWRMTMWRRTMLRRMMIKRLCRWWIFGWRGSFWRILRWRSKSDSAVYGILRSWSILIPSALRWNNRWETSF
jgi:hypothetical protein